MKVGIIRCQQMEDSCPGTTDFSVALAGKGAFEEAGPVEIMGFVACGGCPGKRAVLRAKRMIRMGADAVALASCITRGTPIGFTCPHAEAILGGIRKTLGEKARIFEWTH